MTIKFSKELVVGSNPCALNISLKDPILGKGENKDPQWKFTNTYKTILY